jgi:cytochrome c oxidase subunit 2
MIPEDDLELGQLRLLEVDNQIVIPARTHLCMIIIITPVDVLHSWVVPSLGVKCDVVPSCLNQTSILIKRKGVYYGQCNEICGINHVFMHAPEYIGRLLNLLWLSHTFSNRVNLSVPNNFCLHFAFFILNGLF